jgi:hypothetical protein
MLFLGRKLHFGYKRDANCISNKKQHIFLSQKRVFLKKAMIKKCLDHFFSDSAYFSDAKTIFGMLVMICFVHTVSKYGTLNKPAHSPRVQCNGHHRNTVL